VADPLRDIFGPTDPLADVFGAPNPDWSKAPIKDEVQGAAERELSDPAFAAEAADARTARSLTTEESN
jgi:hypothetical protein